MNSDTQQILDVVDRWAAAELSGDVAAYDALFAEDFRGVGPVGFVLDGDRWVQRHRGDVVNEEFEILDPNVRQFGDTAIVDAVQRQRTIARGHDSSGEFRVLLVLLRDGGTWRIVNIQLSGPLIAPGEMAPFVKERQG